MISVPAPGATGIMLGCRRHRALYDACARFPIRTLAVPATSLKRQMGCRRYRVLYDACARFPMRSRAVPATSLKRQMGALTNVARHAQASRVDVIIQKLRDRVCMKIKDDGKSFDVERALHANGGKRLGLLGMRERLCLDSRASAPLAYSFSDHCYWTAALQRQPTDTPNLQAGYGFSFVVLLCGGSDRDRKSCDSRYFP